MLASSLATGRDELWFLARDLRDDALTERSEIFPAERSDE